MDHPLQVTFIRLIVALPLMGAAINFLLGARLQKMFGKRMHRFDWMRRRHPGVHPRGADVFRDAPDAAGKPLHARRPVEVVRRRRTESRHRVLARSAVDDDGADNHRRRRPHPYLFDRLHARRRRLLALLRMAQPVHLRDAGAGARRQHVADVRRLGRRRAVLVRADRVLVQGAGEHDGRQQGVHREPRRRPGVRDCALQSVRRPASGRTSDAGDARGRPVRTAAGRECLSASPDFYRATSWWDSSRC